MLEHCTSETPASHRDQRPVKEGFWRSITRRFDRDVVENSRLRRFCAHLKTAVEGRQSLSRCNFATTVSNTSQGHPSTDPSENSMPSRRTRLLNPIRRIWKKLKEADEAQDATSAPFTLETGRPDELEYVRAFSVPLQTRIEPRRQYTYYIPPPREEVHAMANTTRKSPEQIVATLVDNNIPITSRRSSLAIESTLSATDHTTDANPTPTTSFRTKRRLSIVYESELEYATTKPVRAGRFLALPPSKYEPERVYQTGKRKPHPSTFHRPPSTMPGKALRKRPVRRAPIPETWQDVVELHRLEKLFFKQMKGRTPIPEEWKGKPSNEVASDDDEGSVKSFVTAVSALDKKAGELEEKRIDSAGWGALP